MYGVTNMSTKNALISTPADDTALARREEVIEQIARDVLRIETLFTRKSDSLDFYEVAVWQVKAALGRAYELGYEAALSEIAAAE
jgi:hypothetical protein